MTDFALKLRSVVVAAMLPVMAFLCLTPIYYVFFFDGHNYELNVIGTICVVIQLTIMIVALFVWFVPKQDIKSVVAFNSVTDMSSRGNVETITTTTFSFPETEATHTTRLNAFYFLPTIAGTFITLAGTMWLWDGNDNVRFFRGLLLVLVTLAVSMTVIAGSATWAMKISQKFYIGMVRGKAFEAVKYIVHPEPETEEEARQAAEDALIASFSTKDMMGYPGDPKSYVWQIYENESMSLDKSPADISPDS